MTKTKLRKRTDEGWDVLVDGALVGSVVRGESSKTGFKRGRCVGQVNVMRWYAYAPPTDAGMRVQHPKNYPARFGSPSGFHARGAAVSALVEWRTRGGA